MEATTTTNPATTTTTTTIRSSPSAESADARWGSSEAPRKVVTLQELFDAPKGCTTHHAGEAFALHVAWIAPHAAAADELLDALAACAHATARDTPCVPTYLFRRSPMDDEWPTADDDNGDDNEEEREELAKSVPIRTPTRLGELPAIAEAHRKLSRGIPAPAVRAELSRRRLDPALLDAGLDAPIPEELARQIRPVVLEMTEIYLDEAAFMQHAHSPDYLAAYGRVMNLALMYAPPITLRLGTPAASLVTKILEPILKERVVPRGPGELLFRAPPLDPNLSTATVAGALFVLDRDLDRGAREVSLHHASQCEALHHAAVSLLTFRHPLRRRTARSLCVVRVSTSAPHVAEDVYAALAQWPLARAACYITGVDDEMVSSLRREFSEKGLSAVQVNPGRVVGYALHPLAGHITAND
eukprot:TRINITY_DN7599_c0_g1_i1.p1 TRINITY_DN7599_c0_g1~~TRINITY_DN7599_c0_g1_i1.p1  ORF type:complete len:415 (+),score=70.29 TRINITY_DN7599_c0_g1_i1:70-1314(+)